MSCVIEKAWSTRWLPRYSYFIYKILQPCYVVFRFITFYVRVKKNNPTLCKIIVSSVFLILISKLTLKTMQSIMF